MPAQFALTRPVALESNGTEALAVARPPSNSNRSSSISARSVVIRARVARSVGCKVLPGQSLRGRAQLRIQLVECSRDVRLEHESAAWQIAIGHDPSRNACRIEAAGRREIHRLLAREERDRSVEACRSFVCPHLQIFEMECAPVEGYVSGQRGNVRNLCLGVELAAAAELHVALVWREAKRNRRHPQEHRCLLVADIDRQLGNVQLLHAKGRGLPCLRFRRGRQVGCPIRSSTRQDTRPFVTVMSLKATSPRTVRHGNVTDR